MAAPEFSGVVMVVAAVRAARWPPMDLLSGGCGDMCGDGKRIEDRDAIYGGGDS